MTPKLRVKVIERVFQEASMLTLEFIKALDLDSRIEFMSLKQNDFIEKLFNLHK